MMREIPTLLRYPALQRMSVPALTEQGARVFLAGSFPTPHPPEEEILQGLSTSDKMILTPKLFFAQRRMSCTAYSNLPLLSFQMSLQAGGGLGRTMHLVLAAAWKSCGSPDYTSYGSVLCL